MNKDMQRKEVKFTTTDEVEGKVEAVFSVFNEIDSDGDVVFKAPTKKRKGKLIINGTEIESLEAYKTLGGSYTYLKNSGYYWDPKDGGWMLNKGAQFYNANPIPTKKKYD